MKNISLITVYNNKILLDDLIKSALKQKNVTLDFVTINNTDKVFSCAAKALNYGFKKSIGEVVVFLHQDIEFMDNYVLKYIYDYAIKNKNVIFGAAGVKNRRLNFNVPILSSMLEGRTKNKYNTLNEATKVFILDECLIACHRSCFDKISFDEEICDGWHLYGADLCLQAQDFAGFSVEVLPMNIWHKSSGCADKNYFKTQDRLAKKYKKYHNIINTTNSFVFTNAFKRILINLYRHFKYGGKD